MQQASRTVCNPLKVREKDKINVFSLVPGYPCPISHVRKLVASPGQPVLFEVATAMGGQLVDFRTVKPGREKSHHLFLGR